MSAAAVVTNKGHVEAPQGGYATEVHNAFMIILFMFLRDMKNQDEATNAGLEKELLLKSKFDNQKDVVQEKQKALQALIDKQNTGNMSDVLKIQTATSEVQAEQANLNAIRGEMNRVFKSEIDPCQDMNRQDSVMFGGILKSYLITERTR
jgi:hypothetical protein